MKLTLSQFESLPFLKDLKQRPRWTLTQTKTPDPDHPGQFLPSKKPVDMWKLLKENRIIGASEADGNNPYMKLCDMVPSGIPDNVTNVCLRLSQPAGDGIVILDIEPDCPDDLRNELLLLPWIYGEISMSGKGFHLVFPSPETFPEIRDTKAALKQGKNYEILLTHNVTFTMNAIYHNPHLPMRPMEDFWKLWEECAEKAKRTKRIEFSIEGLPDAEDVPNLDAIRKSIGSIPFRKTPSDYDDDMSTYEYMVARFYLRGLEQCLSYYETASHCPTAHKYSIQEKLVLLWEIVRNSPSMEWRPKHETARLGMPWLLYVCKNAMSTVEEGQNDRKP